VLVGQEGGQSDFLGTNGYEKMGLPGDMIPSLNDANGNPFANFDLGLGFHFDSAFRRGILDKVSAATAANINGAVIPARSDNDTGNNPHNPMYGIALAGAKGSILGLAGSENTDSGGNSTLPLSLFNPELRPTKVDRPSDVVNLVDTGDLVGILSKEDATKVMESIYRLSDDKVARVETLVDRDVDIDKAVRCGYLKAAHIADRFGGTPIDPGLDADIVATDGTGIFLDTEFFAGDRDAREFQKTASVMKLVMNGFAGAGCVEMGGYDYHGGRRAEGEVKDFRAGQCMGACLEYAAKLNMPLMLYVFSDGSLSSNGALDMTIEGRGKGEWTSDNSSTAGSFFLVYNPPRLGGRPVLKGANLNEQLQHQQLGYMDAGGSVQRAATPMANNVNILVNSVVLNYMALHGQVTTGEFNAIYQSLGIGHGLGSDLDRFTAFEPIVSRTVPVA
jgi:hypothetical protein